MPDLIRAALRAYFDNKMTLRAAPDPGPKKRTTMGLDDELKERYGSPSTIESSKL